MDKKYCKFCGAEVNGCVCEYCGNSTIEVEKVEDPVEIRSADGEIIKTIEEIENSDEISADHEEFIMRNIDFFNPETQVRIGIMFAEGVGVKKDMKKAVRFFEKAALNGNMDGMFRFAEALYNGNGIEKNETKALYFYNEAAAMGHIGARHILNEINGFKINNKAPHYKESKNSEGNISSFEEIIAKVKDYCVEITCCDSNGIPLAQGSGCFISPSVLLTNAHVVLQASKKGTVQFPAIIAKSDAYDQLMPINVIYADKNEDIAICTSLIEFPVHKDFPRLVRNYSYNLGKEVFTIGNGLGRGLAVSKGVISKELEEKSYGYKQTIRTDMSINPGNSGGALFDMEGNIIGMMTFVARTNDNSLAYGLSYAITSNTIADAIMSMQRRGEIGRSIDILKIK